MTTVYDNNFTSMLPLYVIPEESDEESDNDADPDKQLDKRVGQCAQAIYERSKQERCETRIFTPKKRSSDEMSSFRDNGESRFRVIEAFLISSLKQKLPIVEKPISAVPKPRTKVVIQHFCLDSITNNFFRSLPSWVRARINREVNKRALSYQTSECSYTRSGILEDLKKIVCNALIHFYISRDFSLNDVFPEIRHIKDQSAKIDIIDKINDKLFEVIKEKKKVDTSLIHRLRYTVLCALIKNLLQKYKIRMEEFDPNFAFNGGLAIKKIIKSLAKKSIEIFSETNKPNRELVLKKLKESIDTLNVNNNITPTTLTKLEQLFLRICYGKLKNEEGDEYFEGFYQFVDLVYESVLQVSIINNEIKSNRSPSQI